MIIAQICQEEIWDLDLNLFFHSVFHSPCWLKTIKDTQHTPIYIDFIDENNKVGKISGLVVHHSKIRGKELYFYGGPALKELNEITYNECIKALFLYAKKKHYNRINIGSYDNKHSLRCHTKPFIINQRVEYIIPIREGISSIKFGSQFKRNCKKSSKIKPSFSSTNCTDDLLKIKHLIGETHKERVKKNGVSYDHFYLKNFNNTTLNNIIYSNNFKIHSAITEQCSHCMELSYRKNKYAYMLLKGSNNIGYQHGLSAYLTVEVINFMVNNNVHYYNLGGRPNGTDGDGLARFKINSGAQEIICYGASTNYITWPLKVLNPLLYLMRQIPKDSLFYNMIKKVI